MHAVHDLTAYLVDITNHGTMNVVPSCWLSLRQTFRVTVPWVAMHYSLPRGTMVCLCQDGQKGFHHANKIGTLTYRLHHDSWGGGSYSNHSVACVYMLYIDGFLPLTLWRNPAKQHNII